jgi:hypothetical protein
VARGGSVALIAGALFDGGSRDGTTGKDAVSDEKTVALLLVEVIIVAERVDNPGKDASLEPKLVRRNAAGDNLCTLVGTDRIFVEIAVRN